MLGLSLDLFLKLIDRLIALVTATTRRQQAVFRDIITPIFINLRAVITDYDKLYAEITAKLLNCDGSIDPVTHLEAVIAGLRTRRVDLLALRREIINMAKVVRRHTRDPGLARFAQQVEDLFYDDERRTPSTSLIRSLEVELHRLLEHTHYVSYQLGDVVAHLTAHIEAVDAHWETIAAQFADLQYKYVAR